jgi:mannose-6-phosphate isomerase-like protein (cupin superfamily)
VKLHKHLTHSEHIYIVDGEADMTLGDRQLHIKKGDFVFIPKGTPHAVKVTSAAPLRIVSIQAPAFDGTDRVMLE